MLVVISGSFGHDPWLLFEGNDRGYDCDKCWLLFNEVLIMDSCCCFMEVIVIVTDVGCYLREFWS